MYQWEVKYLVFFMSVCGAIKILPVDYMRVTGLYLDCPDMEHRWEELILLWAILL
jgi:hypothetical protein